jgi:hypothetical protein
MSINAKLRLSIPKYPHNKPNDRSPLCRSTTFTKDTLLAQREAQYDKNLKSIIKIKPVNNENLRGSMNIKPQIKKNVFRERSRSVRTKPAATMKSTPREVADSSPIKFALLGNSKALIEYRLQDQEVDMESIKLNITTHGSEAEDKENIENKENIPVPYTEMDKAKISDSINSDSTDLAIQSTQEHGLYEINKPESINDQDIDNTPINLLTKSLNFDSNTCRINYLSIFQENINKINLGIFTFNYENIKINKEYSAKFTSNEYRRLLTTLLEYDYGKIILENLIIDETVTKNPLERHNITDRMRAKMIDWMIEVLGNYNCDDNTFFLSVNIMDRYFHLCEEILTPEDLHIIGICSMFIASKFYDIFPIKLKMMTERVSHGKFGPEEIKRKEENIIRTLGYCVYTSTVYDFINHYVEQIFFFIENSFFIQDETLSEYIMCIYKHSDVKLDCVYYEKSKMTRNYTMKMLRLLNKVITYITKLACYDYTLISQRASLISASCLLVSLKICEEINSEIYVNSYFMNKLSEISGHLEFDIVTYSQRILWNAQSFDEMFQGLGNLKRRHFNFTVDDIGI